MEESRPDTDVEDRATSELLQNWLAQDASTRDVEAGESELKKVALDGACEKYKVPSEEIIEFEIGERKWLKIRELTRAEKLVVRDLVVALVALALPFFEEVRSIGQGTEVLIPILILVLAIVPVGQTTVGCEAAVLINLVGSWPIFAGLAYLIVNLFVNSVVAYLLAFAVVIFCTIWIAHTFPSYFLPAVMNTVVFSFVMPTLYGFFAYPTVQDKDPHSVMNDFMAALSFSILLPPAIHFAGAILIFPWHSLPISREKLAERLMLEGELLKQLRQVYHKVGYFTMYPDDQKEFLVVTEEEMKSLEIAKKEAVAASLGAHATLIPTLFETRWKFDGSGYENIELFRLVTNVARHARSAADDLLVRHAWLIEFVAKHPDKAANVLEKEKEIAAMAHEQSEDKAMYHTMRSDILGLVHEINAEIANCCQPMARIIIGELDTSDRIEVVNRLEAAQSELEASMSKLEKLCSAWVNMYIRQQVAMFGSASSRENLDEPVKRTKLISYMLTLRSMVHSHGKLVKFLKEGSGTPKKVQVRAEWEMSLTTDLTSLEHSHLRSYVSPGGGCGGMLSGWMERFSIMSSKPPFQMAVKFTLGSLAISILSYLPQTRQQFADASFINAMFTFQTILFKLQQGLVVERTAHRLGGILAAFIYGGIAWELSCINGCNSLNGWSLYLLELPILCLYLWVLRNNFLHGYAGFALVRTYATMMVPLLTSSGQEPLDRSVYWSSGGYVVLSSLAGAVLALLLGLGLWPTSGRSALRKVLASTYKDFMLLNEEIIHFQYTEGDRFDQMASNKSTENATGLLGRLSSASSSSSRRNRERTELLELAESKLSRTLYIDLIPLLRAAQLETLQRMNYDASYEHYVSVVENTRVLWRSLWKLHHVGGINSYLRRSEASKVIPPSIARNMMAMNRHLGTAFAMVSSTLAGDRYTALPILRPVVASPSLLKELADDFLLQCYQDKNLMDFIIQREDLYHIVLFRDILIESASALDKVFDFLENFLHEPTIRGRLRSEEYSIMQSFSVVS